VSPRYRIQAIERAVAILNVFSVDESELGVTEIAERVGLHKSTVHRFMVNLDAAGLVERNPRSGRYRLGLHIFELGGLVMQRMNLWDEALPFLEGLVRDTGETGHLAVLDGGEAIYIERVEARRPLRVPSAIGRGYPAHATNLGKVLLADLPRERVVEIVATHGLAA
jgi:IclR family KDG regulon transcriptional repressor